MTAAQRCQKREQAPVLVPVVPVLQARSTCAWIMALAMVSTRARTAGPPSQGTPWILDSWIETSRKKASNEAPCCLCRRPRSRPHSAPTPCGPRLRIRSTRSRCRHRACKAAGPMRHPLRRPHRWGWIRVPTRASDRWTTPTCQLLLRRQAAVRKTSDVNPARSGRGDVTAACRAVSRKPGRAQTVAALSTRQDARRLLIASSKLCAHAHSINACSHMHA